MADSNSNNEGWRVRHRVFKSIMAESLFVNGDTVVVAVSGGADSVALLDLLASMTDLRLNLVIAHLNHPLRGCESDGDETFVRQLAARYHVPCEIGRSDVKAMSKHEKLSLEQAGRTARYAFLGEVAARHGAQAIAVAHHADDQAETILMRLLRGSGASGLAGMATKTELNLIRPLLRITRKEIMTYVEANGLSYCNDSSNADTRFLRNRIRHDLIPHLTAYNPSVSDRLVAAAEALAADEVLLEELTDAAFSRHGNHCEGSTSLSVPGVASEPSGLRFRLYRRAILLANGNLNHITFRHLRSIDRLVVSSRPNASLDVGHGIRIVRTYATISFVMFAEPAVEGLQEILLGGPGSYDLQNGWKLRIEEGSPPPTYTRMLPTVAYFDADAAPFPWLIRSFKAGDRLVPLGMSGHQKVKTIFIDKKVPLSNRPRIPLLFSQDRLIWVCSLKISAEARVTERTEGVLRAEILGLTP